MLNVDIAQMLPTVLFVWLIVSILEETIQDEGHYISIDSNLKL